MSSRSLYRLSGGTLIVSSILIIISAIAESVLYPGHNTTPSQLQGITWQLVTLLILFWSLLFVIALPGMYSRQAKQAGVLGLVGFILLFFGMLEESAFSIFSPPQDQHHLHEHFQN